MRISTQKPNFDVIAIGGSYAGMSAALQLARRGAGFWSSTTASAATASP